MNGKIAIVAVGYNRPDSLARLLHSLERATYDYEEIPLIISIDHSGNKEVIRVAEAFEWVHGEKIVLARPERLGLRRHIISCGDMTEEYGAVMILEDDLYVSPDFYNYAMQVLEYYGENDKIAGIGLNIERVLLESPYPFFPLHRGDDVFFMQNGTSWGQVWNRRMWKAFRSWYDENPVMPDNVNVLIELQNYPDSSWAKYFQTYLVEKDKYYVYSYESLTTNFGDAGVHFTSESSVSQSLLFYGKKKYRMADFENGVKYDLYGEPIGLGAYLDIPEEELTCDLWRRKRPEAYGRFLLTCGERPYKKVKSFGLCMKPMELNVMEQIPGEDICLYDRRESVQGVNADKSLRIKYLEYGYGVINGRDLMRWIIDRMRRKVRK